jgi:hypothetical protein
MGKVIVLPRTDEDFRRLHQAAWLDELVPDFAARLRLWHQEDGLRREHFRADMHAICEMAVGGVTGSGQSTRGEGA